MICFVLILINQSVCQAPMSCKITLKFDMLITTLLKTFKCKFYDLCLFIYLLGEYSIYHRAQFISHAISYQFFIHTIIHRTKRGNF